MNIVLFVNKDLASNFAYNLLKPELANHRVKIYYSTSVGGSNGKPAELVMLEYFERDFVYTRVVDLMRREKLTSSFEFFDDQFVTVPFNPCKDVNDKLFIDELRDFQPDVFLSIRFGKIFREEVIRVPTKGVLNLHSALLPDYRGILGTLHALGDQREEIGCTFHYIDDPTIDTGEIIDIARLKVDRSRSLFWHVINLYVVGCECIVNGLQTLSSQEKLITKPPTTEAGRYYSVPTAVDFERLHAAGFATITSSDYLEFFSKWVSKELADVLRKEEAILQLK